MHATWTTAATLLGLSLIATPAMAATVDADQSPQANASIPAPDDISDGQLEKFVAARADMLDVRTRWSRKIGQAGDKQTAIKTRREATRHMIEAVTNDGLSVDEYNGIARSAQAHPALAKRIDRLD